MANIICGVDIGAETLDARIGQDGTWRQFAHNVDGLAELARFCQDQAVDLVAMEATGGYERLPFAQLCAAGVAVAIVNPRSVRRFAEAMGRLEKTDKIDCGMIAWYAQTKRIQPTKPAAATQQRLTALVLRLRQLTELKVAQTNQRRLVSDPDALATFTAVLATIAQQIRSLENQITAMLEADPLWRAMGEAFRAVKGVADRTLARLAADLPEIGTLSNKAAAKLVGLAPIARDSGKQKGRRPVRGGRESVRSLLYIVAQVVRRHDADFAAVYRKLDAAGKPRKVIAVALARKLLVRLNAKARAVRKQMAEAT